VELEPLGQRLATGLARVAVALQAAGASGDGLERTLAQQQIMLLLGRSYDPYTVNELARDLGMERSDLLAAASTLVKEGLVAIEPSPSYTPTDAQISLTRAGRSQPAEHLNWAADLLAEMHKLNEDKQRQLLTVVTGHIRRLQDNGQIPVMRMCVTCRFFDWYRHPASPSPHHCWLVDSPFGHKELRLRCPDASPGHGFPQVSTMEQIGRHRAPED